MELLLIFIALAILYGSIEYLVESYQSSVRRRKTIERFRSSTISKFDIPKDFLRFANPWFEVGTRVLMQERDRRELSSSLKGVDTHRRCKVCRHRMVIRVNSKTGQKFLGCIRYPSCNYTEGYRGDAK
ncbi:hypothetical protein COV28_01125 [candidate division WWE3 bacterium CG10_big_fil_rev_8_21_14_0_10_48_23]|nr:MAG: hypothetical protein COV28_01125 [candidate division WWE3 bacterium CG10_big_fil_rev_8_21_14_0_10_48_23]